MKMAERLNELGSVCATHGSRLAYHNRCWEAQEGVLERLAELTDPRRGLLRLRHREPHTRWGDPIATLWVLGERIGIDHLKDFGKG